MEAQVESCALGNDAEEAENTRITNRGKFSRRKTLKALKVGGWGPYDKRRRRFITPQIGPRDQGIKELASRLDYAVFGYWGHPEELQSSSPEKSQKKETVDDYDDDCDADNGNDMHHERSDEDDKNSEDANDESNRSIEPPASIPVSYPFTDSLLPYGELHGPYPCAASEISLAELLHLLDIPPPPLTIEASPTPLPSPSPSPTPSPQPSLQSRLHPLFRDKLEPDPPNAAGQAEDEDDEVIETNGSKTAKEPCRGECGLHHHESVHSDILCLHSFRKVSMAHH